MGDEEIQTLSNNLQFIPNLETLELGKNNNFILVEGNQIGYSGMEILANNMQQIPKLKTLNLGIIYQVYIRAQWIKAQWASYAR